MGAREDYNVELSAKDTSASAFGTFRKNITDTAGEVTKMRNAVLGVPSAVNDVQSSFLGLRNLGSLAGPAGAVAFVGALVAGFVKIKSELAEIEERARRLMTAPRDLQASFLTGQQLGGLSSEQQFTGLRALGKAAYDATKDAENELAKLYKANGMALEDRDGKLKGINSLLLDASQLIHNASNEWDKIDILRMLGLSEEWLKLLDRAPGDISRANQAFKDAGSVFEDEVVKRWTKFKTEVDTFSAAITIGLKFAVLEGKDILDKVFGEGMARAGEMVAMSRIQRGVATGADVESIDQRILALKDKEREILAMTGDESLKQMMSAGITRDIEFLLDLRVKAADQAGVALRALFAGGQISIAGGSQGSLASIEEEAAERRRERVRGMALTGLPGPRTVVPDKDKEDAGSKDSFERQLDQERKRVALVEAEARAVGASVGEHARLRTETQLLEAAQRAGTELTDKQREAITLLGVRASEAAVNLAKLKLQNDILFERSTIGFSDSEKGIAGRLRSIYGDDWTKQMQGFEAQQLRINDALKTFDDIGKSTFKSFLSDIRQGKTVSEAFWNSMARGADKLLDKLADEAWSQLFGGILGKSGNGGILAALLGLGGGGGDKTFGGTTGGVGSTGGGIGSAHTGAVLGVDPLRLRNVHPAYFDDAPRLHGGGSLAANERPVILEDTETVFTKGQMAALGLMVRKSSSAQQPMQMVFHNDFRGADAGSEARIMVRLAELEKSIPGRVIAATRDAKRRSVPQ